MSSEDSSDIDSALLAKRNGDTSQPLVEVCNDGRSGFVVGIVELVGEKIIGI
jgi:hypothetical protein